jgi:hypothetical protein
VHALFFPEDAVTLETELHQALMHRRLNMVNPRPEFFFASPAEIREQLAAKVGGRSNSPTSPKLSSIFRAAADGLNSMASGGRPNNLLGIALHTSCDEEGTDGESAALDANRESGEPGHPAGLLALEPGRIPD